MHVVFGCKANGETSRSSDKNDLLPEMLGMKSIREIANEVKEKIDKDNMMDEVRKRLSEEIKVKLNEKIQEKLKVENIIEQIDENLGKENTTIETMSDEMKEKITEDIKAKVTEDITNKIGSQIQDILSVEVMKTISQEITKQLSPELEHNPEFIVLEKDKEKKGRSIEVKDELTNEVSRRLSKDIMSMMGSDAVLGKEIDQQLSLEKISGVLRQKGIEGSIVEASTSKEKILQEISKIGKLVPPQPVKPQKDKVRRKNLMNQRKKDTGLMNILPAD